MHLLFPLQEDPTDQIFVFFPDEPKVRSWNLNRNINRDIRRRGSAVG